MEKTLQIKSTTDYSIFKTLKGNRVVDPKHVEDLKKSMKEGLCISPVQVNEHICIIDGQHRVQAAKELGIPVHYYIVHGADLSTVQRLNSVTDNWDNKDFLGSWITKGLKDYKHYKEFMDTYNFTHKVNILLLTGSNGYNQQDVVKFEKGEFKVANMEVAVDIANKILKIALFYKGYKRRSFISALVKAIKTKGFSFTAFMNKLEYQSRKMVDCSNECQYLELIQEIYNYKNQKENKINLRKL
jgi:hypothetical protein